MSYGTVARVSGFPRHARMVSQAMARSEYSLPWHRVVRSDFTLAFDEGSEMYSKQRTLLNREGVKFSKAKVLPLVSDDSNSLDKLLWDDDFE